MRDIFSWLAEIGLAKHCETFRASAVDFDVLSALDENDLKELGLPLGDRKRLLRAVAERTDRDALPFCRGVPLTLKALKPKNYSETPQKLAEHLKKRRRELGLFQRDAAARMGIWTETYINWEKGRSTPVASSFQPVLAFLGYDPTPAPTSLAERLQEKRRALGVTFSQVARYLGWHDGTLTRYLNGTWRVPDD